jgi:tetratricopeptide (TPR) repeat protein
LNNENTIQRKNKVMTNASSLKASSSCFYPSNMSYYISSAPHYSNTKYNGFFTDGSHSAYNDGGYGQYSQKSDQWVNYQHPQRVAFATAPIPISKPTQQQRQDLCVPESPNFNIWGTNQIFSEPNSPVKSCVSFRSEPNSPWCQKSQISSEISAPHLPLNAFSFSSIVDKGINGSAYQQNGYHIDNNLTSYNNSLFNTDIEYVTSPKRYAEKQKQLLQNQQAFPQQVEGNSKQLPSTYQQPNAYQYNNSYVPFSPPSHIYPQGNWFDHVQGSNANSNNISAPNVQYPFAGEVSPSQTSLSRSSTIAGKLNRNFKSTRVLNFNNIDVSEQQSVVNNIPTAETAQCHQLYKEFAKEMKQIVEETQGSDESIFEILKRFVSENMKSRLPESVHWRVYLFLAEHAKRHNYISEARSYYKKVNVLQPTASQGWLEHAKLEEECGNLHRCKKLIACGLQYCPTNESLLIKGIKQCAEQLNDMNGARSLLARLRGVPLEKCWKIILEGALLESRVGNVQIARKVFKYLIQNVSRHGPIYYEAYKLEERLEQYERALRIVEQGLTANPRYGPLWFAALRLYEKLALIESENNGKKIDLTKVMDCIQRAVDNISKELIWKVWFESAQIEERAGNLESARKSYTKSVISCMKNLRWKIWLAGSRTELNFNNMGTSRLLLSRALAEVPSKTKAVVLIEYARLEEYSGNIDKAREYLQRAQKEARHEWKVFLESILLEMRAGEMQRAIKEAENALEIHRSTGRLWAVLIQLKQCEGEDEQMRVFKQALDEVPKSGEVWCEGARIRLNPLSRRFNLQTARQYLDFAIKFTPQYGDSFIEYLRLELLSNGPRMCKHHYSIDGHVDVEEGSIHIEQLCANADPNYGPLWFHCKAHVLDSSRQVLFRAKDLLMAELLRYRNIYQKAIMKEYNPMDVVEDSDESDAESNSSRGNNNEMTTEDGEPVTIEHFTTGLYALQRLYTKTHTIRDDELRKKYIFGSESPGGLVL